MDEALKGFLAVLKDRKVIYEGDPDLLMLADHFEDAGMDEFADYLRNGVVFLSASCGLSTSSKASHAHLYPKFQEYMRKGER